MRELTGIRKFIGRLAGTSETELLRSPRRSQAAATCMLIALFAGLGVGAAPTTSAGSEPHSEALISFTAKSSLNANSTTSATGTGTTPTATTTTWLCMPGVQPDPCATDLSTTVVNPDGSQQVLHPNVPTNPPIDCFYVYPTVSSQSTVNANLTIESAETDVAEAQAAPFSQDCRVFAPMYPQLTLTALTNPSLIVNNPNSINIAYQGVLSAWQDYMANYNDGRGVVLIGHSQGAAMLTQIIQSQIDPSAAMRKLLVSALLFGGNVTVPTGGTVGGSFQNVPACQSAAQISCVIAYSSFLNPNIPPSGALFGYPGTGVSLLSGQSSTAGLQVLCVNPTFPASGAGSLLPIFPTAQGSIVSVNLSTPTGITTNYVEYPQLYTGECESQNGATWLNVTDIASSTDTRPTVTQALGASWGLHLVDMNISMENLVTDVASESSSYQTKYAPPPVVTTITPNQGPTTGGTNITITGTGFTGATSVAFGSQHANFSVLSDTSIEAKSPTSATAQTVDVTVTGPNGTSPTTSADKFTYATTQVAGVPTISSIFPAVGPASGGGIAFIFGTNFTQVTRVVFGVSPALYLSITPDLIVAIAPKNPKGQLPVEITNSAGTSGQGNHNSYTYF